MEDFAFNEVAFNRAIKRGAFPFELRREARASPVGICVSFEIANMRDRLGLIAGAQTGECEIPPGAVAFCPVKRRVPALFTHSHPAERQPEFRPAIAVVLDEGVVFTIRARPRCQRKRGDQSSMVRTFVIIREARTIVTDFGNLFVELDKPVGTALRCRPFSGAHGMTRPTSTKYRIERV